MASAIFAGGCFWCLDAAFRLLKGVNKVESGYIGGLTINPGYDDICYKNTGHAEAIKIDFDESVITYLDLLTVFFGFHNPTTLNRQDNDVGTQYRSAIFPIDKTQTNQAKEIIKKLTENQTFNQPIVTTIELNQTFYPAENYHQNYYQKNTNQGYCQAIISPKLAKLRQHYQALLK